MGEPSLWNTAHYDELWVMGEGFQPLMGEPSLWNILTFEADAEEVKGFNPSWESRPSGTLMSARRRRHLQLRFNPSWESRPSGTQLAPWVWCRLCGFNPSWESRPSGTVTECPPRAVRMVFQPLMGEPSLWNQAVTDQTALTAMVVSTPHGRAVPLERSSLPKLSKY